MALPLGTTEVFLAALEGLSWLAGCLWPSEHITVSHIIWKEGIVKTKTGHCMFLFKPNSEFCQVHMLYSVFLVVHVTFKIRRHLLTLAQNATWTYSQSSCSWNNFLTTKKSFSGSFRPSQSFCIIKCGWKIFFFFFKWFLVGFSELQLQVVSFLKSLNKMALSMLQEQAALWHKPFDIHPTSWNLIHLDCDISLNLARS